MSTQIVKKPKTKKSFKKEVFGIPKTVKANCYTFALAPKISRGGMYKNRMYKARVGDKCPHFQNMPFDFKNCEQIVKRILCDNPKYVSKLSPYSKNVNRRMDDDHHIMCAWLSPGTHTDFHFARRVPVQEIFNEWENFAKRTPKKALLQLLTLRPKYCFVATRGWSGPPILHDAKNNLMIDPKYANMNYGGGLNYKLFCGLYKVRTRMATVTDRYDY